VIVPTARRLISNTLVVIAGSIAQRLIHFATTMVLARGLGQEQFGIYSFVAAYMFLFSFIVDLGFERVVTREVSRQPERAGELLGTAFIIRVILCVFAAGLAVIIAWMLHLPSLTRWCIVVAAIGMPLSIEILVRGFFQSRFEMHYTFLLTLPGQIAFLGLTAGALALGGDLRAVMVVALANGVATVGLILRIALPKMAVVWRVNWTLVRYLWRESWELGVVILLFVVGMRIDQVILYWLRGPNEVAQYAVAVKIAEALNLVPESVMVTMFPLLAAAERTERDRFDKIYRITVRYLIVLVVPLALILSQQRDAVIRVLFGPAYASSGVAVALLGWWMFFSYTAAVYLNVMIVRSQQRLMARISAVSAVINVTLNLAWIPRWGGAGAAAATLVSSTSSFALFYLAHDTRAVIRVCCREAIRPLAAAAVTAVLVGLVVSPQFRLMAPLPIYGLILLAIGGVEWRDWEWFSEVWRPTRPRA
jgi:PST family polysaccharide transporter